MRASPVLQDPRNLLTRHVALAIDAPMEELAVSHSKAAEHQAELARASALPLAVPKPWTVGAREA